LAPQRFRASLQSVSLSVNQLTTLLLSFLTLPIYNLCGAYTLLLLFVVPGFCCLAFLYRYLPETNGREIHEVIEELKKISGEREQLQTEKTGNE
jgi:H+/Cl- antiporter ClcA